MSSSMNTKQSSKKLIFKFRDPRHKADALDVVLDAPVAGVREMMQEGKMPLPASMQGLSKGQLSALGYHKVCWSKKHNLKYVDLVQPKKQYDN